MNITVFFLLYILKLWNVRVYVCGRMSVYIIYNASEIKSFWGGSRKKKKS